jgi:hypothetical protein
MTYSPMARLPPGVSSAAVDTRLRAVRERVPSFAAAAVGDGSAVHSEVVIAWGETVGPGSYVISERNGTALVVVARARSHCRFVRPLIHFIPDSLTCIRCLFF